MKLSINQAWPLAIENLKTRFRNGDINPVKLMGTQDKYFILVGDLWLAALAISLPNLYDWIKQNFIVDTLCVSIPHRGQ